MRRSIAAAGSIAAAALAVSGAAASARAPGAAARWSRPIGLGPATSLTIAPPRVAVSSTGRVALAFTTVDPDHPSALAAFTAAGRPDALALRPLGAADVLALTWTGHSFALMTGAPLPGHRCCATVTVAPLGASGTSADPQPFVTGLSGPAIGSIVPLTGGGALAVAGTPAGVVARVASDPGVPGALGPFEAPQRLTAAGANPVAVTATGLPGGGAVIAWTESPTPSTPAQTVFLAAGAAGATPAGRRVAVTAAPGHEIDEIALAAPPAPAAPLLAWIESWTDVLGAAHSVLYARALSASATAPAGGPSGRPVPLSDASRLATSVTLSADAAGGVLAVDSECDPSGSACSGNARARAAGRTRFAPQVRLGAIDPGALPALAVAPSGAALAGVVDHGRVVVRRRSVAAGPFGPPAVLDRGPAADLTLATGPTGTAIAAWTRDGSPTRLFVAHL